MLQISIISLSYILWHTDPLLGNDRDISDYTTTVDKYRLHKQTYFQGNNCAAT
jgi:hypothetical protein